ncbi:MAG: MobA/MobL family protein [Rhodomicrobium sp.]
MLTKSLPTFKHTSIGAKTHKARTATAHLSYIMRSEAMTEFQAQNMPGGERGTRVFFDRLWEKAGMPDNARIADKLMIALPVELNREQRYELVRSFMQELGHGRISWCAAHHDSGEDAHNPHAHILFKDADIDTGRKVAGTTTSSRDVREAEEHGWKVPPRTTTAEMRKMWCGHLNHFMERAGIDIRYDPRTLKEQGIDRDPQIHIGPKAQALDEKDYNFSSGDRVRGERSIPYTLFDHGSRVEHNDHIREANRQKEQARDYERSNATLRPQGPPREDVEKRTLREAQQQARKAIYAEQQRDREALRRAHEAEKIKHQEWAKKLYAVARQEAYDSIKEQYADKWQALRETENAKERAKAAAALKVEEKKAYGKEAEKQVNLRRPEKDAVWKAMLNKQEQERLDLRKEHRAETTALARQQIAERLGVHEKWRALHLGRHANSIDAQLGARQGMSAQQKAAVSSIKLHNRTGQTGAHPELSANPREAARRYFEIAREEDAKRESLRDALSKQRDSKLKRAGLAPDKIRDRSAERQAESRRATGKASPRDIVAPGIEVARDKRAEWIQNRTRDVDPQQQIRQAAQSGRALSSEERANASPEVRERAARDDKSARDRWSHTSSQGRNQDKGKGGRSGGGRGR